MVNATKRITETAALLAMLYGARRYYRNWGTTKAECQMRLPGDAWLEWLITPEPSGVLFVQRAVFRPRGLFGRVYWYSVAPFHGFIFGPLARGIEQRATQALTMSVERAA